MDETLLYQLRDDLETLFSTDTDYPNMMVKTSYEGNEDIDYPYIVVEELDNSDVDRFYDGKEHVIDVGYQFTIFAEQTEDRDAKTNVRMIMSKIKDYMRGERYHSLHRVGSSPDAALPNDSNVRIGYMRYNGRIDIDTNTIYRRN